MIDKFFRLSAVWNHAHRELVDLDSFRSDRAKHGIPQAPVGIMVFDREHAAVGGSGAIQQCGAVDRDDAVEIDDAHMDAGRL